MPTNLPDRRKLRTGSIVRFSAAFLVGLAGVTAVAYQPGTTQFQSGTTQLQSGECRIKGNISSSGERIYHVPGQRYYGATRIDTRKGERWFCSESEARAAGWRKARV